VISPAYTPFFFRKGIHKVSAEIHMKDSFIVLSGPQLGARGARRVHGDYMVTSQPLLSSEPFEDTIAIFPDLDRGDASLAHPNTYIPYCLLLPKGVENMLVACCAFSFDRELTSSHIVLPLVKLPGPWPPFHSIKE
jgi:hypothetical protein